MRRSLILASWIFTGLLVFASAAWAQDKDKAAKNTCVSCHTDVGGDIAEPIEKVKTDVHGSHGFSCVNCHGGDANEADMERSMDPRKGFIGQPSPKLVSPFCGKCHSSAETMKRFDPSLRVDQESEFATSVHGKRIAQGDTKPATCISCHGSHGIRAVKDPAAPVYPTNVAATCGKCHANAEFMKSYGIPTDQLQKYQSSVHAEALMKKHDLSAPTCNDCHGNHGAAPPGTASTANVCGTCHVRQSELFGKSPHGAAFEAMSLPGCIVCHNNHDVLHPTDELVGTSPNAACTKCHDPGEPGSDAAGLVHKRLTDLNTQISAADEVLNRAVRAGMEVSKPRFALNDARDSLVNARVVVHSFAPEDVEKVVGPGIVIAEKAQESGFAALAELLFRRKGLAVSLVLIALATLSIYFKIRHIERDQ